MVSFAEDIVVYRREPDREEIAKSIQAELDTLDGWCDRYKGRIHPC